MAESETATTVEREGSGGIRALHWISSDHCGFAYPNHEQEIDSFYEPTDRHLPPTQTYLDGSPSSSGLGRVWQESPSKKQSLCRCSFEPGEQLVECETVSLVHAMCFVASDAALCQD